jgi:hypothetical protein
MSEPMWDYEDLKTVQQQFPAGTYYVGDLCYVMNDRWDEICDQIISDRNRGDGEFKLRDGIRFASYGTRWGDGCYQDQNRRMYGVDAGIIGCIATKDIDIDIRGEYEEGERFGGQIIKFDRPFTTSSRNGMIIIGHIEIDTDPSYDDEDDWD